MFDQIQDNIRKTRWICVGFVMAVTVAGYGIVWSFGAGALYLFWMAVPSVGEAFLAYFLGDKLLIASFNARAVLLGIQSPSRPGGR